HEAKRCVGGRSYSELHQLLFDMPASASSFPEMFTGEVQPDKAYHLFPKSVDWQIGSARLYVGTRRPKLKAAGFLKRLGQVAAELQKVPGSLDAVIFCATNEWLVWWEHSSESTPEPNTRFNAIAVELVNSFADWGLLYLTPGRNQRFGPCMNTAAKGKGRQTSGRDGPTRAEKRVPRLAHT